MYPATGNSTRGVALVKSLLSPEQPEPNHLSAQEIPPWCVCTKYRTIDTPTENVCRGKQTCTITLIATIYLEHNMLTIAILNWADIFIGVVTYSPSNYRKAAHRQYILWSYGHLGRYDTCTYIDMIYIMCTTHVYILTTHVHILT